MQIESVILEHPGVCEAAVLGMPDETFGEVVTALVAPAKGAARPSQAELTRMCRDKLAAYQVRRHVHAGAVDGALTEQWPGLA